MAGAGICKLGDGVTIHAGRLSMRTARIKKAPKRGLRLGAYATRLELYDAANGPHIHFVIRIETFPFSHNAELLHEHIMRANTVHSIVAVIKS